MEKQYIVIDSKPIERKESPKLFYIQEVPDTQEKIDAILLKFRGKRTRYLNKEDVINYLRVERPTISNTSISMSKQTTTIERELNKVLRANISTVFAKFITKTTISKRLAMSIATDEPNIEYIIKNERFFSNALEGITYYDGEKINPLDFPQIKDFMKIKVLNMSANKIVDLKEAFIEEECQFFIEELFKNDTGIFKEIKIRGIDSSFYNHAYFSDILSSTLLKHKKQLFEDYLVEYLESNTDTKTFEFYLQGCSDLGIASEITEEYYESANELLEQMAYDICMKHNFHTACEYSKGFLPTQKSMNAKINKFQALIRILEEENILKTEKSKEDFLSRARGLLTTLLKYKKYAMDKGLIFEMDYSPLIQRICMIEINEYFDYEILVDLSKLLKSEDCINDFLFHGIVYVSKFTYIREETRDAILEMIPASPELEYPAARTMRRKFYLHYGPTNSGKTYQALEALKEAKSGTYLGPLRLLALEVQDKLNESGVPCSMLTGEEEEIIENAQHISSTVEKANMFTEFDTCVIDECQMIGDPDRGFAWTRAILGIQAKEIYLLMGPEALSLCIHLIELCGDEYELVEHQRRSELEIQENKRPFKLEKEFIEPGDAFIVFSKKKVLNVASHLINLGVKTSIIYGNLPYSVRKKQVEMFLTGETEVVVSTDAIGMGINLPVRRIIFLDITKFNGKEVTELSVSAVKQIAGRAGRNQETGYVNTTKDIQFIQDTLNKTTPVLEKASLGFSDEIISIDAELSDILKVWKTISTGPKFSKMQIQRYLDLDQKIFLNVTKKEKLKMINIPFDEKNEIILDLWLTYCRAFEEGKDLIIPKQTGTGLDNLELYYKQLDLYYSFSKNFDYIIDLDWLREEKELVSDKINMALIKNISSSTRKCRVCGKPLKWDYPYPICQKCHDNKKYLGF